MAAGCLAAARVCVEGVGEVHGRRPSPDCYIGSTMYPQYKVVRSGIGAAATISGSGGGGDDVIIIWRRRRAWGAAARWWRRRQRGARRQRGRCPLGLGGQRGPILTMSFRTGPLGRFAMHETDPFAKTHQNRPAANLFCRRTRCTQNSCPTQFGGYVRGRSKK